MTTIMRSLLLFLLPPVLGAQAIDFTKYRMVDLTHSYNAQTIYWPNAPSTFKLEKLAYGPTPGGYFYSSYAYSAPEHGGTHLDAPIHFAAHGLSVDKVPLEKLAGEAVVIDVSAKALNDR